MDKFEIVITDHKVAAPKSIFDTLHESGLFIEGYYKMAFVSWGPGEYLVHFRGSVSSIVEQTISRLLIRNYGTKLIRR